MKYKFIILLITILFISCSEYDDYNEYNNEIVQKSSEFLLLKSIAAGKEHTLALKEDGTVWAWGNNEFGQLGNGSFSDCNTPAQVIGVNGEGYLTNIISIAAGYHHTIALKEDGTVWVWGNNEYGQLGNSSIINSSTPVQVETKEGYLNNIISVDAGDIHTMALKDDGTVWAWGSDKDGILGNGIIGDSRIPFKVVGVNREGYLTNIISISAGYRHNAVLTNNGTIYTWGGYNRYGELGLPYYSGKYAPNIIKDEKENFFFDGVIAVEAGRFRTIILRGDGTVWTSGIKSYSSSDRYSDERKDNYIPTKVSFVKDIIAIDAGREHNIAIQKDGCITEWTPNNERESVKRYRNVTLCNIISVAAGYSHNIALKDDGTVWTWGSNEYGQLGNGSTKNSYNPIKVMKINIDNY